MKYTLFLLGLLCLVSNCSSSNKTINNQGEDWWKNAPEAELLDSVQTQTFRYFWDFAEPTSGLARERFHPNGNYPMDDAHIVTSGGSGFGVMAILVGIKRGFITREAGVERLLKITDFLEKADRFHGVWSHWIDGTCLLYTSPSPRDRTRSRMPSSA